MTVTARVICDAMSVQTDNDGNVVEARVHFQPDYADGRNEDWAKATPNLGLDMTLNGAVANNFEKGGRYTLSFDVTREEPDMSTDRPPADNPFTDEDTEAADAEKARQDELERTVEMNEEFKRMQDEQTE